MTEAEIFESVTGGGSSDFAAVANILNRHGAWCLIGGLAVNCYVEPVFTVDADLVVAAEALQEIKNDLSVAGFVVEEFAHSMNASRSGSDLRIQLTKDPRYQNFLRETQIMTVLGEQVPVASLKNITLGKIWAWQDTNRRPTKRKKDELDLMRILESHPETREMMPQEIKEQVPE